MYNPGINEPMFFDILFCMAGFTAKGYDLANNGWEITAAKDNRYHERMQFYLRHESAQLYGNGFLISMIFTTIATDLGLVL